MGWHIMTPLQRLNTAVAQYNKIVQRNNAAARSNPRLAARLAAMRSDGADVIAASKVREAYQAYQMQGMGWQLAAAGSAVGIAAVIAVAILYVLIRREEQAFAAENPVQAAFQSAMTGMWAVLGIGVIALGGLAYWDYRKGRELGAPSRRGAPPFDDWAKTKKWSPPEFGKTKEDPALRERMAEEEAIHEAFERAERADAEERWRPALGMRRRFGA